MDSEIRDTATPAEVQWVVLTVHDPPDLTTRYRYSLIARVYLPKPSFTARRSSFVRHVPCRAKYNRDTVGE
jgi:hypothetical protein